MELFIECNFRKNNPLVRIHFLKIELIQRLTLAFDLPCNASSENIKIAKFPLLLSEERILTAVSES